ncbi:uncharacterized protein LOC131851064 [Achroia grisella]|uniref:uncharacterized protein LOC131851064 n=1 Tax=Achroia grisella TaxID=688607 RepID=UPI0027D1E9C0|nr:uncharacterized protein LOC131851064 [Achroia grisella]
MKNTNTNDNCREPIELRMLKQQLANLTCTCKTYRNLSVFWKNTIQVDQGVQVKGLNCSYDQFVQTMSNDNVRHDNDIEIPQQFRTMIRNQNNLAPCSTCFAALNALHKGTTHILKDEELETNPKMFTCDKSAGRHYRYIEKTTSVTDTPDSKYFNLTFSDTTSQYSSDTFESNPHIIKRSNRDKVHFLDDYLEYQQDKSYSKANCTCIHMNNFIDSIRPPMVNMF